MEPERRIEKLLRAFAKKRREQAGDALELRPAARQRLHKEMARRSPEKSGGGFFSNFFPGFRPRLAFALCFLAIISAGVWLLLPAVTRQKPATLAAANSERALAPLPEQPAPMPAPAPPAAAPPVASDEERNFARQQKTASGSIANQPNRDRRATVSDNGTLTPSAVLENAGAQTNSLADINLAATPPARQETPAFKAEGVASDSFAGASGLNKDTKLPPVAPPMETAATAPALAPAASEPPSSTAQTPASSPGNRATFFAYTRAETSATGRVASQLFYRLDAPMGGQRAARALSIPTLPVLASFRVEQNGGEIRVVDADGSIYTGAVQVAQDKSASSAPAAAVFQNKRAAVTAAKITAQSPAVQNYFFRVAGTNHHLNQNIVFSGNLIPLTNAWVLPTNAGALGGAAAPRRVTPGSPAPSFLSNSRISGKVLIGNQTEIEVNAMPGP